MANKKLENINKIIELLAKDTLTTSQLAEQIGVNIKTIQNYINELKDMENIGLISEGRGRYRVKNYRKIAPITDEEERVYLSLALDNLEDLKDISKPHDSLIKELNLKELNNPYYIKPEDYESLNTSEEEIKLLEEAIKNDKIIEFTFKDKRFCVEAYRLVNFDGIWYLFGKDTEEKDSNPYKTWLLKYIDNVEIYYDTKHNMEDEEIEKVLDEAESEYFVKGRDIIFKLKIDNKIADIITLKEHFPKQKTIKKEKDYIVISTEVSTYKDIEKEIKSWLPYIEILEPKEYQDSLVKELNSYLKKFEF